MSRSADQAIRRIEGGRMLGSSMVPCHDAAPPLTRFFWSQVSLHGLSKSSLTTIFRWLAAKSRAAAAAAIQVRKQ